MSAIKTNESKWSPRVASARPSTEQEVPVRSNGKNEDQPSSPVPEWRGIAANAAPQENRSAGRDGAARNRLAAEFAAVLDDIEHGGGDTSFVLSQLKLGLEKQIDLPPAMGALLARLVGVAGSEVAALKVITGMLLVLTDSQASYAGCINPAGFQAMASGFGKERSDRLCADFAAELRKHVTHDTVPQDVNALVQWLVRESYLDTCDDLTFYADKVKMFNAQKKALRAHASVLRNIQSLAAAVKAEDKVNASITPTSGGTESSHDRSQAPGDTSTSTSSRGPVLKPSEDRQVNGLGKRNFGDRTNGDNGFDGEGALAAQADAAATALIRQIDAIQPPELRAAVKQDIMKNGLRAWGGVIEVDDAQDGDGASRLRDAAEQRLTGYNDDNDDLIGAEAPPVGGADFATVVRDAFASVAQGLVDGLVADSGSGFDLGHIEFAATLPNFTLEAPPPAPAASAGEPGSVTATVGGQHCIVEANQRSAQQQQVVDQILGAIKSGQGPAVANAASASHRAVRVLLPDAMPTMTPYEAATVLAGLGPAVARELLAKLTPYQISVVAYWRDTPQEGEFGAALQKLFTPADAPFGRAFADLVSSTQPQVEAMVGFAIATTAQRKDANLVMSHLALSPERSTHWLNAMPAGERPHAERLINAALGRGAQTSSLQDAPVTDAPALDTDASDGVIDAVELVNQPPFLVADPAGRKITTQKQLEDEIARVEELLQTVGEDAQLANLDLQSILQRQQQSIQTVSNISKLLHETAMAVIRQIGG